MQRLLTSVGCAAALAVAPGAGLAASKTFNAVIGELNNSGVSGSAEMTVNTADMTLNFAMALAGLEPGQLHVQHIHGRFDDDGNPRDSFTPTLADDADGDGFVELLEGAPRYGPIVLELRDTDTAANGGFPVTQPDGTSTFSWVFDLTTTEAFGANVLTADPDDRFTAMDLLPLGLREIVIHGLTLAEGQGANGGEADGTAGYKTVLPVAAGEITPAPIPLPAAGWALVAGLAGLGALRRARRG